MPFVRERMTASSARKHLSKIAMILRSYKNDEIVEVSLAMDVCRFSIANSAYGWMLWWKKESEKAKVAIILRQGHGRKTASK